MRLVYSAGAVRQLAVILAYIEERNPQGARNVQRRIQQAIDVLLTHPLSGVATGYRGTRRLIATPYSYAIIYSVGPDEIQVVRIHHTAPRPT